MMRVAMMVGLAVALSSASVGAQSFVSGNWKGKAHWESGGVFTHCTMGAEYNSGTSVLFAVDQALYWRVGFVNPQWNLTPGSKINLDYWIDGSDTLSGIANVQAKDFVLMELPAKSAVFNLFRKGSRLMVSVRGGPQLTFRLTGTSAALQVLLGCAETKGQSLRVASAPQAAPTPTQQQAAARQLEATRIVANLIAPAGLDGFRILAPEEMQRLGIKSDAAWAANGVAGTLDIVPAIPGLTAELIASRVLADDAGICKGEFMSGSTPDPDSAGSVRRVYGQCRPLQGDALNTFYTITAKRDGGFVKLGIVSKGDAEPAKKAETQLRGAVFRM